MQTKNIGSGVVLRLRLPVAKVASLEAGYVTAAPPRPCGSCDEKVGLVDGLIGRCDLCVVCKGKRRVCTMNGGRGVEVGVW